MKTSEETQEAVTNWYSREDIWDENSSDKTDTSIDRTFVNINHYIKHKTVLNLGCFYPTEELYFGPYAKKWYAIDLCKNVIEKASKLITLDNIKFEVMDMRNLKYQDDMFDTVLDFSSGDHLLFSDYKKVIQEVKRVLKPGGTFIILYANIQYYPDKLQNCYDLHGFERRTYPKDLYHLLENNNFFILKTDTFSARSGILCKLNDLVETSAVINTNVIK